MAEVSETVTFNRSDIIDVLRDINLLVVSTDRIGSAHHDRESDEQYNAMFVKFFDDLQFFRRLATARTVLSEPFCRQAGDDGMDELERALQDVKYWPDIERTEDSEQ